MTDCFMIVNRLLGRNFSENVLRPMRYNSHNHRCYYLVDCHDEKASKVKNDRAFASERENDQTSNEQQGNSEEEHLNEWGDVELQSPCVNS